jgi:hypothetical protein
VQLARDANALPRDDARSVELAAEESDDVAGYLRTPPLALVGGAIARVDTKVLEHFFCVDANAASHQTERSQSSRTELLVAAECVPRSAQL